MKKKYKLIACDIDGTLVNDNKVLSQKTFNAINEAVRSGVIFVLSTGRPKVSTKKISDLFSFDIPLILYNGAVVLHSKSDEVIYQKNLTEEQAISIIDKINSQNGTYSLWKNEQLFVNRLDNYTLSYKEISKIEPRIIDDTFSFTDVTKIIWFSENQNLRFYQKNLLTDLKGINFFTSHPTFLEFVSENISKATALEKIGSYYNIKSEEMIACGDGFNDIPMLKYAELGVAMQNSEKEVIDNADFVTLSNNEDGVCFVINKYILGE